MENISRISDPFYRYKMPTLIIRNQSNKTVLINLEDISKSLNRSQEQLLKMFSYKHKSSCKIKDGNAFLSGKHELTDLKNTLYWYIRIYVLCSSCNNPETIIHCCVKKSGKVKLDCQACSQTHSVKNGDPKLNKWIINNNKLN